MAVERSLGWAAVKKSDQMTGKFKNIKQLKFQAYLKVYFLIIIVNLLIYSILNIYSLPACAYCKYI